MWLRGAPPVDETCDLRKWRACESVIWPPERPQAWVSHGASLSRRGTVSQLGVAVTSHEGSDTTAEIADFDSMCGVFERTLKD